MTNFKEILTNKAYNSAITDPTVSVSTETGHTLFLTLDKKEVVTGASYLGPFDLWLSGLCELVRGKDLAFLRDLTPRQLETHFQGDQTFWDLWAERAPSLWFMQIEMFRAAVDKFEGREQLYLETSPLVCRCFGTREDDILKGHPGKAGMGCRSCLPQIGELLLSRKSKKKRRYYKQMAHADWLILTDDKLNAFPEKGEWGMEVGNFKGQCITISYTKKVSQKEEELMSVKLQDFLGDLVDSDLSFFLRRS